MVLLESQGAGPCRALWAHCSTVDDVIPLDDLYVKDYLSTSTPIVPPLPLGRLGRGVEGSAG